MRVGLSRRITSFLIDILPIFMIVVLLQQWFIGDILKDQIDPNYDQLEAEYLILESKRADEVDALYTQYENEEITEEEYYIQRDQITLAFNEDNIDLFTTVYIQYWLYAILYWIISINVVYYVYVLRLKGQTFGRKILKIELQGKISWHSLLLREILWKNIFYVITFGLGIPFDIGLILFTKKKRTLRDMFSQTYLGYEGVNYPF